MPRFHFVDATQGKAKMEQQIASWVDDQSSQMLASTEDGVLTTNNFTLETQDFLEVSITVTNYVRVRQFEERNSLQAARQSIIKEKGFDSEAYLAKLIEDQGTLDSNSHDFMMEVLKKVKVNEKIYECSFENFVGDEQGDIDAKFVKNYTFLNNFHPIKNQVSKNQAEGSELYFKCLNGALTRFAKKDTLGNFKSVAQFMYCFDYAIIDFALAEHGLTEADVRALAFDHELIESKEAVAIFEKVAVEINKHLDYEPPATPDEMELQPQSEKPTEKA